MPTIRRLIATRVFELREHLWLLQKELAADADVSVWDISRLESGARIPRLEKLDRIAAALGTDLSSLFNFHRRERSTRVKVREAILHRLRNLSVADMRSVLRIVEELAIVRRRRRRRR